MKASGEKEQHVTFVTLSILEYTLVLNIGYFTNVVTDHESFRVISNVNCNRHRRCRIFGVSSCLPTFVPDYEVPKSQFSLRTTVKTLLQREKRKEDLT